MGGQVVVEKEEKKVVKDEWAGVMRIVIQDLQNGREIIIASFKKSYEKNFMEKLAMRIFKFLRERIGRFIETEMKDPIYWERFPDLNNIKPYEKKD